ncbi:MAG: endo alpha-1,4 polygalactosaminidase [Kofleriaceae bacterium]
MRFAAMFALVTVGGAACDNNKQHLHPEAGTDAPAPLWWSPKPGEAKNWDIQVGEPFDIAESRVMYTLDLWDVVPAATTMEYGDGDPVAVPAGSLATAIAELHARMVDGKPTIVICRVSTGAIDLGEPDARKFPGFEASPPDRPDLPAPGSVIGWSTFDSDGMTTNPSQRYLDISATNRDMWSALVFKRLDLAKQIGCDGVAPTYNDVPPNPNVPTDPGDAGFAFPIQDMTSWYASVAEQAHARELSVGMVGGYLYIGQTDELDDDFDWLMIERCGEFEFCDNARPFITSMKPVFAIDYPTDEFGDPQSTETVCGRQGLALLNDGLIKDLALSSALRAPCVP